MRGATSYYDEIGMTALQRDTKIVEMRAAGYSQRQIAAVVGLSPSGVHQALERIAERGVGSGRVRA